MSTPRLDPRQLAEIRISTATLLDLLMKALVPEERQQPPWSEHIEALADLERFLSGGNPESPPEDDLQFTRKQQRDFGALLRDRRDAAGLTRLELARLAKVSDGTIKLLETARQPPSRKSLIRLLALPQLGLTWEDVPVRPGTTRPMPPNDPPEKFLSPPKVESLYGIRAERELAVVLLLCCSADMPSSSFVFRNAIATVLLSQLGKIDATAIKDSLDRSLQALTVPTMPAWFRLECAERLRGTTSAVAWLLGSLTTEELQGEIESAARHAEEPVTPPEKT